ncbi:MAG: hypothetical protein DLM53_06285 [Candidatus Eremiobacter antarcticus]|nr:S9 family peptidase [Candidatus Eremiobacteraeota bacterium]MBC5807115.1 S9 family peptidase [Candidatus Eremiobacteraeota bacterium]PZR62421.1 MAG: hypothetical protein DLM53_06285 [Candidatus Eremiobacter sp. RRmetagenome_bin22]
MSHRFALAVAVAVACALSLLVPQVSEARFIQLTDVQRVVRLSEPRFSPDGGRVAFVLSRPDVEKATYDGQIVLLDLGTRGLRQLTYGRKDVSAPRWSPDGQSLAFIAATGEGENDHDQVFAMPMNGGDARAVTKAETDVQQFAWKPDGATIAYVCADVAKNKAQVKKHNDAFEVGDNDYLTTEKPTSSHVWLVPSSGGKTRRLTGGVWSISTTAVPGNQSPLSWSPDGKTIAIGRFPNPYYGDSDAANVAIVDVRSGALRRISDHAGLESMPLFSPLGAQLAYQWPKDGIHDNGNDVLVTAVGAGNGKDMTAALDRTITWYRWTPDGNALLVAAEDKTKDALWLQPLQGPARRVDLGDVMFYDADVSRKGAVAFIGQTPHRASELYFLPSLDVKPQMLTNYNKAIASLQLGDSQPVDWTGPGGFAEDGVLIYPPQFIKGKKYPLVLVIHGGPESATTQGFADLEQLLAARGYLVFAPNYRGSTNLGDAYERAITGDTGDGPGKDVMAGVAAVQRLGIVDSSRMAVSGWSYGGFMTSWLEGHYDVWKAAVQGAALNDWIMDYAISWYVNNDLFYLGGPPFAGSHQAGWRTQSPIAYQRRIKAPTLIMADTGDANVPIINSYEMYHALKDNHVTVQFIAYPVNTHFPDDPVRTIDVYRRWIAWMDRYLRR